MENKEKVALSRGKISRTLTVYRANIRYYDEVAEVIRDEVFVIPKFSKNTEKDIEGYFASESHMKILQIKNVDTETRFYAVDIGMFISMATVNELIESTEREDI